MGLLTPLSINGLKHVGKSTVSRLVARDLDIPCFDTDDVVLDLASLGDGDNAASVRSVYRTLGKNRFQQLEAEAVESILKTVSLNTVTGKATSAVIATGGGICDNPPALQLLKEHTRMVFLDEDPEVLYRRIITGGIPAYLDRDRRYAHFMEIGTARRDRYRTIAQHTVTVTGLSIRQITDILVQLHKEKLQEEL
ncbi:MAG: shikimate kinase [Alkalispirochaeta sp.]